MAVQFSDGGTYWIDKSLIKQNAGDSLQQYFNLLNQPNEEINPKRIKLK